MKFENLEVWKRATQLCVGIYRTLRKLKDYGFRDQITRSALSILALLNSLRSRCTIIVMCCKA